MSVEEAVEVLQEMYLSLIDVKEKKALWVALTDLYRNISKEPKEVHLFDGFEEEFVTDMNLVTHRSVYYSCPECGYDLGCTDEYEDIEFCDDRKLEVNYCPNCGQSISFPKLACDS